MHIIRFRIVTDSIVNPRKLEHGFGMISASIVYLKGMRIIMFQLSGFYCHFACQ